MFAKFLETYERIEKTYLKADLMAFALLIILLSP
jgi:hypothetical protein